MTLLFILASKQSGSKSVRDREKEKKEQERLDRESSRLNLKQCEQTVRTLTMLALVETKNSARMERCVQAVFFVEKSLALWFQTMREIDCAIKYQASITGLCYKI